MKEKMTGMQGVEKMYGVLGKVLPTAALLYALSGSPLEGHAQNLKSVDEGVVTTEVVSPKFEEKKTDTIGWETAIQGTLVKDNEEGVSEGDDGEKKPGIEPDPDDDTKEKGEKKGKGEKKRKLEEKGKNIDVHGMVRLGSDVTPLLGSVLSDKPALMLSIDVSHPKTGLGTTLIRLDDFDKSMDSPASQVTILDMYWQKQIGKASVMLDGEYMKIDKLPGADSFTPIIGCTYDAGKGWTFDTWAGHCFQKRDDVDVVRLGITKKLNESLSLAAQGFYSSDLSKKFYGRVQADVKLGGGLGIQLSCIAKDGKLTPTAGVLYKF